MQLTHWLAGLRLRMFPARRRRSASTIGGGIERLQPRQVLTAGISDLRLVNDTGTPGDNITTDSTIQFVLTCSEPNLVTWADVEVNGAGGGYLGAGVGTVTLFSPAVAPGPATVRVRANSQT